MQELHRHTMNDIAPLASATAVPLQCMCTGQAAKPGRGLLEDMQTHMSLSALRRRLNDADLSGVASILSSLPRQLAYCQT